VGRAEHSVQQDMSTRDSSATPLRDYASDSNSDTN